MKKSFGRPAITKAALVFQSEITLKAVDEDFQLSTLTVKCMCTQFP